jgi:hypothetical protein
MIRFNVFLIKGSGQYAGKADPINGVSPVILADLSKHCKGRSIGVPIFG